MSGQPPVTPPTLSYKSKAIREQEEKERREREEQDRVELERLRKAEEARTRAAAPSSRGSAPTPIPAPLPGTAADEEELLRAPVDLAKDEKDGEGPSRDEVESIDTLGPVEQKDEVEPTADEVAEEEGEPVVPRSPPRPPKSPDMRPVYAGFILVFVGLAQLLFGIWMMVQTPNVGSGTWSQMAKWGNFSLGISAVFLGILAVRGGLWSFRKERFDVVKVGAIAATLCVWALWIPWLFGLLALLIVHRSRDEYYPFYDPKWDSPAWAKPPPGESDEEEKSEEEAEPDEEAEGFGVHAHDVEHGPERVGLQEAHAEPGTGWEDLS
jgi:hypothetical protein